MPTDQTKQPDDTPKRFAGLASFARRVACKPLDREEFERRSKRLADEMVREHRRLLDDETTDEKPPTGEDGKS